MKSDYTCYSGKDVTLRMLWGAYRLDCMVYPNQYRGALACLGWRHRNPDIYSVVVDNATRKVVAYTLFIPVTESAYSKLVSGDFIDVELKAKDVIRPEQPGDYHLYVSSIVVDPAHRRGMPGLLLFQKLKNQIAEFETVGIRFPKVAADILSSDAEHVARHLGMTFLKESSHKSRIYVCDGFFFS